MARTQYVITRPSHDVQECSALRNYLDTIEKKCEAEEEDPELKRSCLAVCNCLGKAVGHSEANAKRVRVMMAAQARTVFAVVEEATKTPPGSTSANAQRLMKKAEEETAKKIVELSKLTDKSIADACVMSLRDFDKAIKRKRDAAIGPRSLQLSESELQMVASLSAEVEGRGAVYCHRLAMRWAEDNDLEKLTLLDVACRRWLKRIAPQLKKDVAKNVTELRAEVRAAQQCLILFDAVLKELPATTKTAEELLAMLGFTFRAICGVDPTIGGNLTSHEFRSHYLDGSAKPDPLAVLEGWSVRYAKPRSVPIKFPVSFASVG